MKRLLTGMALLLLLAGCGDEPTTSPLTPDNAGFSVVQDPAAPVVNTLADGDAGSCDVLDVETGTDCTLREAIAAAEPGATITFAPGVEGTITLASIAPGFLLIEKDLVIDGPGADVLAISASSMGTVFGIANATVTIRGLTARDGRSPYPGIRVGSGADLTLEHVRVTNNEAVDFPYLVTIGAGIDVKGGKLTLVYSTVDGNRNRVSGLGVGGIGVWYGGSARLYHSTVSGNYKFSRLTALSVWSYYEKSDAMVLHSTVNGSVTVGDAESSVLFKASALVNPSWSTCSVGTGASVVDGGYNVADDASCGFGSEGSRSFVTGNPLLGPLADNGGPTPTHALLSGSPLVDWIADGQWVCGVWAQSDQRGVTRPQGAGCEPGAFEARAYPFGGFFAPVQNLPVLNEVKAGRAVPLKFSLDGDEGLAVLATGYPTSEPFSCDGGSPTSEVTETATAGQSGLSYDALLDTYTYVWKTSKEWVGTCRRVMLRLSDEAATTQTAEFRFVK